MLHLVCWLCVEFFENGENIKIIFGKICHMIFFKIKNKLIGYYWFVCLS